jgi:hypothetical protein
LLFAAFGAFLAKFSRCTSNASAPFLVAFPFFSPRGIAINHWYRVKIQLDPTLEKGEIVRHEPEEGFPNTPSGGKFDRVWGMGGWKVDPDHKSDPYAARKMPE